MKSMTSKYFSVMILFLASCNSDQRHDFIDEPINTIVVPAPFDMRVNRSSVSDLSIILDGGDTGEITVSSSWRNREDVENALNVLMTEIFPKSESDISEPYEYISQTSGEKWLVQIGPVNDYSKAQFLYVSDKLWTWVNFDLNSPTDIDWKRIIDSINH